MTAEDLDLKPSTVDKHHLSILHWVTILIGDWKKNTKRRTFEKVKNTEHKNKKQLKAIKYNTENIKEVTNSAEEPEILKQRSYLKKLKSYKKILVAENKKLEAVTKLRMF